LVVLGEGSPVYHRMLLELRARYPNQVGVTLSFDEPLAHQIEAGADIYLMPSQFEPSGLNQLYSLKYGTIPIVRATGGLADTIVDCTPETVAAGTATGFRFVPYDPDSVLGAVRTTWPARIPCRGCACTASRTTTAWRCTSSNSRKCAARSTWCRASCCKSSNTRRKERRIVFSRRHESRRTDWRKKTACSCSTTSSWRITIT